MMPLVFLHGWGQSARAWHHQTARWPDATFLDLPGHGGTDDIAAEQWIGHLAAQLPESPCLLVGWSLGGMLAMQLAHTYPEKVAALALIATTPRFTATEGWPHGCAPSLLDNFGQGVASQSARTMSRFFALMFHGDGLPRNSFNTIARAAVDRDNPPTRPGLEAGLSLLATLDLRAGAAEIDQPALVMHGSDDAVVPVGAGEWLARTLPNATLHRFERCGHAPFLSQPESFQHILEAWCQNISVHGR
jgi:pimeloyl-[acyl-carrier protein] methyl ester esterase